MHSGYAKSKHGFPWVEDNLKDSQICKWNVYICVLSLLVDSGSEKKKLKCLFMLSRIKFLVCRSHFNYND